MSKRRSTRFRRERTTFEWALLGVSAAAVASIVVGLLVFSLSFEAGPPNLRVTIRRGGSSEFVVRVSNAGGTTAEDVIVDVRNETDEQEVEFRSVPKGDYEEAFVTMPGTGEPRAEVTSFKEP